MSVLAYLTREHILTKLRRLASAKRAKGVTRLAIFGSRARGNARPDSDLNVVKDHLPPLKSFVERRMDGSSPLTPTRVHSRS